jgi:hypothetical protein
MHIFWLVRASAGVESISVQSAILMTMLFLRFPVHSLGIIHVASVDVSVDLKVHIAFPRQSGIRNTTLKAVFILSMNRRLVTFP